MSDTLIQDNTLKGSPILSYGQSSPKRVWSGPFIVVLSAILVSAFLLSVLFWFFTKVPVPDDAVLIAVLPARTQLPTSAPSSWLEVTNKNKIFPMLVGYTGVQGLEPTAFAIKSPSIFDLNFLKTGKWPMLVRDSSFELRVSSYKSPASIFGFPFGKNKVWLSIDLKKTLGAPGLEFKDLPEKLSGYALGGVWRTGLKADDQFSLVGRKPDSPGGFTPVRPETSGYIKNAFASQGIDLELPEPGSISWNTNQMDRDYEFQSLGQMSESTKIALLEAKNIFDLVDYSLPDQVIVKNRLPPLTSFASNTHYFTENSFKFSIPNESPMVQELDSGTVQCPGQILAVFDQSAVENICSWLGFCAVKPEKIVITGQDSMIDFCYTGL